MKLKKFLLPLLVTPLFLVSCGNQTQTESETTPEPTPKLVADVPVIFNYLDSEGNCWSVNTETREIFKNGNLFCKYEVFSDTIWYSGRSVLHVKEDGILIENFFKEGNLTLLTLVPEPEPEESENPEESVTNAEGK